jgi:hypothetical protein
MECVDDDASVVGNRGNAFIIVRILIGKLQILAAEKKQVFLAFHVMQVLNACEYALHVLDRHPRPGDEFAEGSRQVQPPFHDAVPLSQDKIRSLVPVIDYVVAGIYHPREHLPGRQPGRALEDPVDIELDWFRRFPHPIYDPESAQVLLQLRRGYARAPGTRRITALPAPEKPACLPGNAPPAPCLPPSCLAAIPLFTMFPLALPDRNAYKSFNHGRRSPPACCRHEQHHLLQMAVSYYDTRRL